MKIIYAKFKGYVGFNAVMGLDELEIDFSNAKHPICLIVGMNGSGKSTLLSALNIFPDNSSSYTKNKDAYKILRLIDNQNLYEIEIQSQADGRGGRKTTKAFIRLNGEELNPNGNVSSYKEIISNEFELDSNFIGLSMMSSVDRGLGDKTPSERKKFVGNVIENLVTYNNMYKTLNKKSLLYKSHIGTLHTKIQSAGDKNALESNLKQLENQQTEIEKCIEQFNYEIVYIQTKSEIDPEEAKLINDINSKRTELESEINTIQSSIDVFEHQLKISPDDIINVYEKDKELLDVYSKSLNDALSEWKFKQEQLIQTSQTINQLNANIGDHYIDKNLESAYSESNTRIKKLNAQILRLHLVKEDVENISRIKDLIKSFSELVQKIDVFYDQLSSDDISYIVNEYTNIDISQIQKGIDNNNKLIQHWKDKMDELNRDLRVISVLENRPKKCKIDSCPFISDAYKLSKSKSPDMIVDKLSEIQDTIKTLSTYIDIDNKKIQYHQSLSNKSIEYQIILSSIMNFDNPFDIHSYYGKIIFNEINDIGDKLCRMYSFNNIRDPKELIESLNVLQEYKIEAEQNQMLAIQYEAYRENLKVVNSTKNTIKKLEEESDSLIEEVSQLRNKADKYKDLVNQIQSNYNIKVQYAEKVREKEDLLIKMNSLDIELQKFEKKSYEAAKSLDAINSIQIKIDECKSNLEPVKNQISDIKGRLTLLDSYYQEYNKYNESYQFIEILKKYCSPTGGGIQTVFMQIYMAKTLELSNQILSMLFGGTYRLIDFIINQNEFRIPFIGPNGIPVDDISNGSNSQICMFGMAINLVLLHQASTKYNIAYLDEIDGGLDHRNRFEFINALYNTIPILGIDQLFMISHSMEADMSNVDIIKLKTYNDFEDTVDNGNVIFDYKNFINNKK